MLLRRTARPLLASWFLYDGIDAARRPAAHLPVARRTLDRAMRATGVRRVVSDRQLSSIVRVHGLLTIGAGLNLAWGKAPRMSALLLAALSAPLAYAYEPVTSGPTPRSERIEPFVRQVGALGAALLVAADSAGKPGLAWRFQNARHQRAEIRAVSAHSDN